MENNNGGTLKKYTKVNECTTLLQLAVATYNVSADLGRGSREPTYMSVSHEVKLRLAEPLIFF